MFDKILRAKHWQVFSLLFGLPFVTYLFFVGYMFSNMAELQASHSDHIEGFENQAFEVVSLFLKVFIPVIIVCGVVFFSWFWSLGIKLQEYMHEELRRKTGFFKVTLVFPLAYFVCVTIGVFWLMSHVMEAELKGASFQEPEFIIAFMPLFIPCHLFAIFSQFYNMYYTAKTIKTAELQRQVSFGDYIGEFFLMWFYPIGIWIIQPKVNVFVEGKLSEETMIYID